ncbi:metallophosphoesterase [Salinisphaera hydrothermalis]|uniref:Calcineurin phosphoesterase domain-containing protein n=1 Tax=Salinisphaera hydrothermalis (strain C41B8) TaxID=1304275 RepID=A0A084IR62_SALHC|nr:metallophosphoesterase [Salinisphaera hydrothermalis]KEZ79196.1 Calcineurin phosphoesterase domain-containing protein [Salinisphaera hydrothermalis C41B8]
MPRDITVLHITDPHLLARPGDRLHGWDVAAAFEHVLEHALSTYPAPDAIVLGGDLVDDESSTGYRWLDARLAALNRPVLAIAGNHDDPQAMAAYLSHAVVHDVLTVGGWQLIGLSTHCPGSESGRLGTDQLAGLDAALAARSLPTLVCLHHPPVDVGSAWIDAIGLIDRDALCTTLSRHTQVRGLLCGHVHQRFESRHDSYEIWTTPSTMRQFRPRSPEFAEDDEHSPGYRCLRCRADGTIATRVHRVPRPQADDVSTPAKLPKE